LSSQSVSLTAPFLPLLNTTAPELFVVLDSASVSWSLLRLAMPSRRGGG